MTHTLMMASKMLQDIDRIDFVRIDGDRNDLPWQYSIDKFPTLLIFPENRFCCYDSIELDVLLNELLFLHCLGKRKVEFSTPIFK